MLPRELLTGLYLHQAAELEHLLATTSHRCLAWEMGVGKTVPMARLGWALGKESKLYCCPASCRQQVARELMKWGRPDTRVQILEHRDAILNPDAEWVVVNYDLLLTPDIFKQLIVRRWALLVLDEAHMLRNITAKRTRLVLGREPCLASCADRVIALTGTLVVNSPADLYPLTNRLFPHALAVPGSDGKPRRMRYGEFTDRYCVSRTVNLSNGKQIQVPHGARNTTELRAKLAPHVSRLRLKDTLDLPTLQLNEFALAITPNAELTAALAALPSELIRELETETGDELLALLNRYAAQLATLRRVIGIAKAEPAADRLIERLAGGEDRVIAFHHHKAVADAMLVQLRQADITAGVIRGDTPAAARTKLIDAFTAGKLQALLLQNQAGSLGLNLQSCRYAAIVEPDWTAATTEQAIGRLYRAGQVRGVTIDFLLSDSPLDEHIVGVARCKAAIAASLIDHPPGGKECSHDRYGNPLSAVG
jgi:SNF2 family DNA or RNA helicase